MTEPPRPPGEGNPGGPSPDPTSPPPPPASTPTPGEAPPPGYAPPPAAPQYETPTPPPSGGGYPPAGGYPPQGTYYGAGGVPTGYANNDEKTWALVAHFGGSAGMLIGAGTAGWIAPLIALLAKGNQSPTVRAHAVAALNFQLLWSIIAVVGWIFTCIIIGFFVAVAAMIIGIIFGLVAGVKANEGELYRYPMSVSMIK